ncbi:MAG: hypothetical protein HQ595_01885, partial [Candidatus Omnitrophica bacterium]|nr:hypothetical protein [Candidatus Omnitrophota bacterium]
MSHLRDIKLEKDGAVLYFNFLPWDSDFFAKDSFIFEPEKSKIIPSASLARAFKGKFKNTFVTAKIDKSNKNKVFDFFYSLGFKYIDTEAVLKYCHIQNKPAARNKEEIKGLKGVKIEKVKKNENLPYADLVSAFNFSRFHKDAQIPKEKADLLWINYIKNFRPSVLNHIFIARVKNDVAGII